MIKILKNKERNVENDIKKEKKKRKLNHYTNLRPLDSRINRIDRNIKD